MNHEQQAFELAMSFFNDKDKVQAWMEIPNPMFGDIEPSVMIALGRGDKLIEGMKCMLDGEFP